MTKKMPMRRTDGWAAQYLGVGTNKGLLRLKTGLCRSTVAGGGGGGFCREKKRFRQTPLSIFDVLGPSSYFKKYCIIL